jgi:hypothetical protein
VSQFWGALQPLVSLLGASPKWAYVVDNIKVTKCSIAASATTMQVRETEAEAVSFVVYQSVRLQDGAASQAYIQLWHGDANLLLRKFGSRPANRCPDRPDTGRGVLHGPFPGRPTILESASSLSPDSVSVPQRDRP